MISKARRTALKRISAGAISVALPSRSLSLTLRDGTHGTSLHVEHFFNINDGTDWMAAFQRASNRLYELGGGTLHLSQSYYYLGRYRGADVGGKILSRQIDDDVVSAVWLIPSNVTVVADQTTQLDLGGGQSAPLGFTGTFNILTTPLEKEHSTDVVAVNLRAAEITVKSTERLIIGQTVRIAREAQPPGGTPSNEDAPSQFLTIRSISGNTIAFAQPFTHRFDAVQDLVLRSLEGGTDYPRNIFFENLRITTRGKLAYLLHSRTINSGWTNVTLGENVNASWGTSEQVRSDNVVLEADTQAKNAISIESTSNVEWGSLTLNGNGSDNAVGGLLVDDHSRFIHFRKIVARNFMRSGVTFVYGVDAVIDDLTLVNCARDADPLKGFSAALSVGFPADGAGPNASKSSTPDPRYLVRNSGTTRLHVRKLTITGPTSVPIRSHDANLTIDQAYIEFANTGSGAPIVIGESGVSRSDPAYFPRGGLSDVHLGHVQVRTVIGLSTTAYIANARSSVFQHGTGNITASRFALDGKLITVGAESEHVHTTQIHSVDQ